MFAGLMGHKGLSGFTVGMFFGVLSNRNSKYTKLNVIV